MDGFKRSFLFMKERGIWDSTAFACSMATTLAMGPFQEAGKKRYVVTLTTLQAARKNVYPYLTDEQIEICRGYVNAFYGDPLAQIKKDILTLYPICVMVFEDGTLEPVDLRFVGLCSSVQDACPFRFGDETSMELLFDREPFEKTRLRNCFRRRSGKDGLGHKWNNSSFRNIRKRASAIQGD